MTGWNWFQLIFTIVLVLAFVWAGCTSGKRADRERERLLRDRYLKDYGRRASTGNRRSWKRSRK